MTCRIARIISGSVPVKDCYRKQDDGKKQVSGCEETNKNAASVGALRRVCKIMRFSAKDWRSELRCCLRWRVGRLSVAIESLARGFSDSIAKHVTKRRAVGLALLSQLYRIGSQFIHAGPLGSLRWAASSQQQGQQERERFLHSSISSGGSGSGGRAGLVPSGKSMSCTRSMNRDSTSETSPSRRSR